MHRTANAPEKGSAANFCIDNLAKTRWIVDLLPHAFTVTTINLRCGGSTFVLKWRYELIASGVRCSGLGSAVIIVKIRFAPCCYDCSD